MSTNKQQHHHWPAKFDIYALPLPVNPDPQIITVFASLVGELLYVMIMSFIFLEYERLDGHISCHELIHLNLKSFDSDGVC